ncbi:hypothetical protein ABWH96_16180 [Marivirga tractuosa]|uniref:hypothetical protein n=1 Tax=Marivirga tractuosa TaxID=1006 RepID=UPI0035CF2DC0
MKKVKLTADLELSSNSETIVVENDDDKNVCIKIPSTSAVSFPLGFLLKLKSFSKLTRYLNQKIIILFSENETIIIENCKVNYLRKWFLFKLLLTTILKKGI